MREALRYGIEAASTRADVMLGINQMTEEDFRIFLETLNKGEG